MMMDDPSTVGPERSSKKVGKVQGICVSASQSDVGILMVHNYICTEGKYNGSIPNILVRNAALSDLKEMSIVGRNGLFRFAGEYAQARTHKFDAKTLDAVVEYNIYVIHY
ncbi:hypothetical protein L484_007311 [Morus notabilis]|uniref:Dirigent protein n=2 Tax=Morus notabilis TaxID=981085 RepID=W9RMI7_9ROSA|nr:hypothetical protein L484_007311 [Morus notabilis]